VSDIAEEDAKRNEANVVLSQPFRRQIARAVADETYF
jgi:hypothetical protein